MTTLLPNAESAAWYLLNNISLGQFDAQFVASIVGLKQVTTNQVELFYKIIYKHKRQLAAKGVSHLDLVNLPWRIPVVESSAAYTNGKIRIEDDQIIFTGPYKRPFIDTFRHHTINPFVWDKEKRCHSAAFSTHALRILVESASKHYEDLELCPITSRVLASLGPYIECTCWEPTLLNTGGNLIIAATNPSLDDALQGVELTLNTRSIATLVAHGVKIHNSVFQSGPEFAFAAKYNPRVEVTKHNELATWLANIGCDMVYISISTSRNWEPFKHALQLANIKYHMVYPHTYNVPDSKGYSFPVSIKFSMGKDLALPPVSKEIMIVNSSPIYVK